MLSWRRQRTGPQAACLPVALQDAALSTTRRNDDNGLDRRQPACRSHSDENLRVRQIKIWRTTPTWSTTISSRELKKMNTAGTIADIFHTSMALNGPSSSPSVSLIQCLKNFWKGGNENPET